MTDPLHVLADELYGRALGQLTELLGKLRLDYAFVGDVAWSVYSGEALRRGAIDALAITSPDRAHQLPMMASNRGFEVDKEEVEATRELELVPLRVTMDGRSVRIHVLFASNALYAKMVRRAGEARFGEETIRVVTIEDLALLLSLGDDEVTADRLKRISGGTLHPFDVELFNQQVRAIGLGGKAL